MINPEVLLTDLKRLLGQLEGDLRERSDEVAALGESLRAAYDRAKQAERTAQPFETWREEYLTQVAAAWILACVFVRFIEDNALIDPPLLAGSGPRLAQAKDQRTLYFQQHPTDSDRDYLYFAFRKVEALPAAAPLFDERHNPLWAFGVSGDGATLLIEFWQRVDPATGLLAHDFSDPALNTRFLGDLYQDLSEAARKKYALLQTPEFVEEFILDRTLTPALAEFGLAEVRLIDPACGSGHFLLGGFRRVLQQWQKREPAVNVRELAQRALDAVSGVDLNPYAVAIARFRLLIAALKESDIDRLADAPAFRMNLATGDSLLHGPRPGGERQMYLSTDADPLRHVYDTEDSQELRRILGAQYHVVVGNPPYITVKDRALNNAYRQRFGSCHRQYSLAVPFMERFFDLAIASTDLATEPAGYVGMITANSFMKREFGKKLIEDYIPRWDLTHVIDTSGAYIPGHGTPTVILFGRHRRPVSETIRAVLGIRGEPATPDDPSRGLVWSAIVDQIDRPDSQSGFVSVTEMPRLAFQSHPWSIGGGGAAELKSVLDDLAAKTLEDCSTNIGFLVITGEDNCLMLPASAAARLHLNHVREIGYGEAIRDWSCQAGSIVLWPNDAAGERLPPSALDNHLRFLWPYRTSLKNRKAFGVPVEKKGIPWWALREVYGDRLSTPLSIAFAFVATHNHFVLDRAGKVFNRSAPIIKLPPDASEEDHLALLGVLNSSTACFWLKQVCQNKGATSDTGVLQADPVAFRFEFDTTKLASLPLPDVSDVRLQQRLVSIAADLDRAGRTLGDFDFCEFFSHEISLGRDILQSLRTKIAERDSLRLEMVRWQEDLDWLVYEAFGLLPSGDGLCTNRVDGVLRSEDRPFLLAPVASADCSHLGPVDRARVELIRRDDQVALIEQPQYKRRWFRSAGSYDDTNLTDETLCVRAFREWLLRRIEADHWRDALTLVTCATVSDRMKEDQAFMQVAAAYRNRADFDVTALVTELIESEAVPFLPVFRYKPTGLRKRDIWERAWNLQRREDASEEVGEIPVPPKYTSADFLDSTVWSLRGKLDVPTERFISYPHAQREADQTLVIGWAGWDHLQRAKALAAYYVRMKDQEGWTPERLKPILGGLVELIPWLKQGHNELDPTFGIGMGDYFAGFVDEEARALGFTLDDVRAWEPPARNTRHRRRTGV